MNKEYILAIDQGTSSCRSLLVNREGNIVGIAQKEFRQIYPQSGWVEHDPEEIWETQMETVRTVLSQNQVKAEAVAAIGITNQRETTVVWNKESGKPIHNAIVWQDKRTSDYCETLRSKGWEDRMRQKTGLVIDAYFSGTKLKWILDNVDGARDAATQGNLCFGTIDTWLMWKLSEGKIHATDHSNASRTMLYNIENLDWDEEILAEMDIPTTLLPTVHPSAHAYGSAIIDGTEIPICGVAGDQQSALFGQACLEPGTVKG